MELNAEKFIIRENAIEVPKVLQDYVRRRREALPMLVELSKINDQTIAHSEDVALCIKEITDSFDDLTEAEKERLVLSGYLHDVGKNGIDRGIIEKPGELTPQEKAEMDRHTQLGRKILAGAMPDIAAIVDGCHKYQDRIPSDDSNSGGNHDMMDGENGANSSKGNGDERIMRSSEILAYVDQFHALIDPRRRYRKQPISISDAAKFMLKNRHFSDETKKLTDRIADYFIKTGKFTI